MISEEKYFQTLPNSYDKSTYCFMPIYKRRLIRAMFTIGYNYDYIENGIGKTGKGSNLHFNGDFGRGIWLNNWKEVREYARKYCD